MGITSWSNLTGSEKHAKSCGLSWWNLSRLSQSVWWLESIMPKYPRDRSYTATMNATRISTKVQWYAKWATKNHHQFDKESSIRNKQRTPNDDGHTPRLATITQTLTQILFTYGHQLKTNKKMKDISKSLRAQLSKEGHLVRDQNHDIQKRLGWTGSGIVWS